MIKDSTTETIQQDISEGTVLLDFWAPWCGPCKQMMPVLEELSNEVTIVKVNLDDHHELGAQFGVRSIPTLMVYKNGEKTNTLIGATTKEKIQAAL